MTSTQIVEGYTITNTISDWITGGTITTEYIEKLNKKWSNERDKRLGDLKFYLNGNLIYTEDSIPALINAPMTMESAKQCALIAVDEIIKSREEDSHFDDKLLYTGSDYLTVHPMYLTYWLQVKEEIEKL
jgi:hypothetical protein